MPTLAARCRKIGIQHLRVAQRQRPARAPVGDRDARDADDVLPHVVHEHAGPHFLHAPGGERAEDARGVANLADKLQPVERERGAASPAPAAIQAGVRRALERYLHRGLPRTVVVARRGPAGDGGLPGCVVHLTEVQAAVDDRASVEVLPRAVAGRDGVRGPVVVGDHELREQRLPVAEVVPDLAEAEQAAPPPFAQHRSEGVVPGPQQRRDVVGLIQVRHVVLRESGIVVVVTDARAVEEHLVDPARGDVETAGRDPLLRGRERGPQHRRGVAAGIPHDEHASRAPVHDVASVGDRKAGTDGVREEALVRAADRCSVNRTFPGARLLRTVTFRKLARWPGSAEKPMSHSMPNGR